MAGIYWRVNSGKYQVSKKKLAKFAELASFSNVVANPKDLRGKWAGDYFKNSGPITLDLGCGKGEYTIALAGKYPERNFIGLDVKGARLWSGAGSASERELANVAFIRGRAEMLAEYFAQGEVNEIWLAFPDPFPKRRHAAKRLTGEAYLDIYRKVITPGGLIHVKTDDPGLFDFTLANISANGWRILELIEDLYALPAVDDILHIQTKYERQFLAVGKKIRYVRFTSTDVIIS